MRGAGERMSQPPGTAADNSGRIMTGVRLADRYLVQEIVGYGGMATVFHGVDTLLDRQVAIKVLNQPIGPHDSDRDAFLREARTAASLTHPGIDGVYDANLHNGWPYIVMQYLPNGSLKERIDARAPLPAAEAVEVTIRLAEALAYGHRHGVVHCDVKPQNVLFDADGEPKLVDFGISQTMAATAAFTSTVSGTAGYVAPEQLEGLPLDGRADVYSLGTVLYQTLTGRLPFEAPNVTALATRRLVAPPRPVQELNPDVPSALAAIVMRTLERDRERRYTADELAAALRAFQRGAPGATAATERLAPGAGMTQVWRRPPPAVVADEAVALPGRSGLFWTLAALLAALLLALLIVLLVVVPGRGGGSGGAVSVPDVTNTRLDDAANSLHNAGLKVDYQLVSSD